MVGSWSRAASLAALVLLPVPVGAQQPSPASDAVNLFFDCQAPGCNDVDYLRREVPFVNWVRDREVADVHVLVTSQVAGGGGRRYTLAFIGRGALTGEGQELQLSTAGDATEDERRAGIAERLKLGLVPFVAMTSAADRLRVTYAPVPDGGPPVGVGTPGGSQTRTDDPWNYWTFRINGQGFINGEAASRSSNTFGSFQADRTTEAWKVSLRLDFSQNVQRFEVPDTLEMDGSRTVEETREDWGVGGTLVRSIGAQWAIGLRSDVGSSTFFNQELRLSVTPGLEYDFVPYSESSRRSITLQYLVGPSHFVYQERTIFDETVETRMRQTLTGRISLVQPWGRWSTSVTGAQYLHDTDLYSVSVSGNFNVRLFRGFSVRMSGNYSWIRDQLHVSAQRLSQEQVLLRQRQLETSYRYFTSFGIEYRFGSIFNNVVNPRFGQEGGEVFFFF